MLNSLAFKLGYKDSGEMLVNFKCEKTLLIQKSEDEFVDIALPITKVYFIDKLQSNQRSMISRLPIVLNKGTIIACPNCSNMTEKELLKKWLMKNKTPPICKKSLICRRPSCGKNITIILW